MNTTVTPSSLIAVETSATEDQVWYPDALFAADWSGPVTVTTAFQTDVVRCRTVAEARMGFRQRPVLTVGAELAGMSADDVRLIRSVLARNAGARFLCPLYPDAGLLDSPYSSGTVISGDFSLRRIFPGQRLWIGSGRANGRWQQSELAQVSSVASDGQSITLTGALSTAYPKYSKVFPVIECHPDLTASGDLESDQNARVALSAVEVTGLAALPPLVDANYVDPSWAQYAGMFVMDQATSWEGVAVGFTRPANAGSSGIDQVTQMLGTRAMAESSVTYRAMDRATAWKIKQKFDSSRGRLFPFVLPSASGDLTLAANILGSSVQVKSVGAALDWSFFPYLAVYTRNPEQVLISSITSVTRSAGVDTVNLLTSFGSIPTSNVRRVTSAAVGRWDTDALVETWETDGMMTCKLPFIETNESAATSGITITAPVSRSGSSPVGTGAGPTNPTPTDELIQLLDCNGSLTSFYISGEQISDVTYIYDPVSNAAYTADPSNDIGAISLPAGGTLIDGYETLQYPPDSSSNPSWVPECLPSITTGGVYATGNLSPQQVLPIIPDVCWLEADWGLWRNDVGQPAINTTYFQEWQDRSPAGNDFTLDPSFSSPSDGPQLIAGNGPAARPIGWFTQLGFMDGAFTLAPPFTIYLITTNYATAGGRALTDGTVNWLLGPWGVGQRGLYNGGTWVTGSPVTAQGLALDIEIAYADRCEYYRGGFNLSGSSSLTPPTLSHVRLGGGYLGGELFFGGIFALLIYSGAHNQNQVNMVTAYLMKWGPWSA